MLWGVAKEVRGHHNTSMCRRRTRDIPLPRAQRGARAGTARTARHGARPSEGETERRARADTTNGSGRRGAGGPRDPYPWRHAPNGRRKGAHKHINRTAVRKGLARTTTFDVTVVTTRPNRHEKGAKGSHGSRTGGHMDSGREGKGRKRRVKRRPQAEPPQRPDPSAPR